MRSSKVARLRGYVKLCRLAGLFNPSTKATVERTLATDQHNPTYLESGRFISDYGPTQQDETLHS